MENRKRILAVLLAGTMIAGSLAGCGSKGGSDTPATDTPVADNSNNTEQAGTETAEDETTTEGEEADTTVLSMEELEDLYSTDFKLKQPVPDNWSEYDRIILGCPIWLNGAATPVKLFLDENNLDDKTFYPFTIGTLDEAETLTTQLSLDNWRTGFAKAESFEKGASPETVAQWVDTLNSEH